MCLDPSRRLRRDRLCEGRDAAAGGDQPDRAGRLRCQRASVLRRRLFLAVSRARVVAIGYVWRPVRADRRQHRARRAARDPTPAGLRALSPARRVRWRQDLAGAPATDPAADPAAATAGATDPAAVPAAAAAGAGPHPDRAAAFGADPEAAGAASDADPEGGHERREGAAIAEDPASGRVRRDLAAAYGDPARELEVLLVVWQQTDLGEPVGRA